MNTEKIRKKQGFWEFDWSRKQKKQVRDPKRCSFKANNTVRAVKIETYQKVSVKTTMQLKNSWTNFPMEL